MVIFVGSNDLTFLRPEDSVIQFILSWLFEFIISFCSFVLIWKLIPNYASPK